MITINMASLISPGNDGKRRLEWNGIMQFLRSEEYSSIKSLTTADILFSLKGFDFINPDGLVWLLLIGDDLKIKNNYLWLEFPKDNKTLEYFKSSHFHKVALDLFSITNLFYLDDIKEHKMKRDMGFYKINIESLSALMQELASFIISDLPKQIGISSYGELAFEHSPPFLNIIKETAKNAIQHSREFENVGWGYFVVSQMRQDTLRFCIGDAGRGLFSSLQTKQIKVKNDFDAISHALLFRFYERQGEGLFRVVQFVSHLNGVIRIRSCAGEAFLDLSRNFLRTDDETKHFIQNNLRNWRSNVTFPGVQLQIDLRRQ